MATRTTTQHVEGALSVFRERASRRARERRRRQAELRGAAGQAARTLAVDFGARRVVLFGSVAAERADERSDVDLAVEGVSRERYFEALAALSEVVPADVDLVLLEEAPESLRALVESEGVTLHDAR